MKSLVVSAPDARARRVEFIPDALVVHLEDGRSLTVPLEWFPRLRDATPEARKRWELIGRGFGIHWPDLDEDLSVAGLLGLPDGGPFLPTLGAAYHRRDDHAGPGPSCCVLGPSRRCSTPMPPPPASGSVSIFRPNSRRALLLGAVLPADPAALHLRGSHRVRRRGRQPVCVRREQPSNVHRSFRARS